MKAILCEECRKICEQNGAEWGEDLEGLDFLHIPDEKHSKILRGISEFANIHGWMQILLQASFSWDNEKHLCPIHLLGRMHLIVEELERQNERLNSLAEQIKKLEKP